MAFRFPLLTLALVTAAMPAVAQTGPAAKKHALVKKTPAKAPAKDAKAAADSFSLDLPADQDPPPEVHLNPPDVAAAAQPPADSQPAEDHPAPSPAEAANPSSSAPAEVPPPVVPVAAHPSPDADDPAKVDATPIPAATIPASDVAAPAAALDAPPPPAAPEAAPAVNDAPPASDKAPAPDAPADSPAITASAPPPHAEFTLDTPIAELIADPRAKAVLDKDMPGLSDDPNLGKFSALSLRKFQPLTGGQLTDKLLQQTANDLVLAASGNAPSSPGDLNPKTMPAPKPAGHSKLNEGR